MTKYLKKIGIIVSPLVFVSAFLIRIVLSGTTFHVDLSALVLAGNYINRGHVLTFYDQVRLLPQGDSLKQIYTDKIFNYQPLSYLVPSLFYLPFKSFLESISQSLIRDSRNLLLPGHPFEPVLLIYKLPFLVFDLLTAIFITRLVKEESKKKLLQLLWLFNPVAIFVTTVMAQTDIMVVFFLLLALICLKENNLYRAAIFTAISILFKPVGILLIPLLAAAALPESFSKAAKIFFLGFGIYFLGILPYLSSVSFRTYALFAEQTGKSTFAGITIASGTSIPWFFIAYATVIVLLLRRRLSVVDGFGIALASSIIFSHFHPQWFIWLTPWLMLKTISPKLFPLYFGALFSWFLILLSFDFSLHLASFWWLGFIPNRYLFPGSEVWTNLILAGRAFLIPVFFLLPHD
ncbi:hypothetical protein HYU91_02030 [Candidatus Collierbacteria bacterium]|nr:hypothetical protein [Candidatus Collierbacteria bacterium]